MNKVKIIVDSTADLSPELYKEYDMEVIPLNVIFGEENFLDNVTLTPDQLYQRVKIEKKLPHSSAASPAVIEEVFKKYIDQGYDIVFTGIGSTLSTNFQSATIAKQAFPEDRIYLIDSLNLSSATGLIALKAAKLAKEGLSAMEICEICKEIPAKLSCQFVVDTLDYLHKGGRCSGTAKIFGHLFHVHPMIKVIDGKLTVHAKPRGTLKMCTNELLKIIKADLPNIDMDHVMITHAGSDEDVTNYLKTELGKLVDPSIIRVTRAGCVISTHCGYGTIGILYIKK